MPSPNLGVVPGRRAETATRICIFALIIVTDPFNGIKKLLVEPKPTQ
jgi:hypothetical protein